MMLSLCYLTRPKECREGIGYGVGYANRPRRASDAAEVKPGAHYRAKEKTNEAFYPCEADFLSDKNEGVQGMADSWVTNKWAWP